MQYNHVTPAQAGVQPSSKALDSCLRGNDDVDKWKGLHPASLLHIPLFLAAVIAASPINSADSTASQRQSSDPQLDTLVVEGRRLQKPGDFAATSVTTLDQSVLLNMPGTANDLNRVLAVHPSVLSLGTLNNNSLYVRGGNPTENVYLVDGIAFDDINHYPSLYRMGGAFGFIDPDMIDKLDFYAGGIPANFPSRTSSAIDISLRNGATDHFGGRADVSLMGFGLAGEGPLPASKGSFMLSMRIADLRLMSKLYDELGTPRFGDGLFKCTFDLKNGGTLLLHAIGSFDRYRGIPGEPAEGFTIKNNANMKSSVEAGSLTWKKIWPQFSSSLQLSISRTEVERSRTYTGPGDTVVLNYTTSPMYQDTMLVGYTRSETILYGDKLYTFGVRKKNFYAGEHITLQLGEHVDASAGLSAEYHRIHLHDQYGIGESFCRYYTVTDSSRGWPDEWCNSQPCYDHLTTIDALQTGAYVQAAVGFGPISIMPGLRADYYALLDRGGLSPRLSAAFRSDAVGHVAASVSVIRQLPAGFDRILNYLSWYRFGDQVVDAAFSDLRLQRCIQGAVAYGRNLGRAHSFGIEAYVKRYDGQYELRSPESRNVVTSTMYDNRDEVLLRIAPPHGQQRVHGVEATASSSRDQRLFYSGAFSYSVSNHEYVDGSWLTDKFGDCKKASLLTGFSISKKHVLTANLLVMTGRFYEKLNYNWRLESFNDSSDKTPYAGRLDPVYFLSARYSFEHRLRRTTIGAYLEAINILNKKQIVDRETDELGYIDQRMMGILPNAAVMVTF